ncbi:ribonuclease III domain-containing protein [Lentinula edodes]|uniref:Ribonuclease III domain-containing protein n=1 Tax=Lentinula lateritia TaxID=40482 RepID=A0A9W9DJ56_9AGAR|nr:ribonuclease III domain-containing protein [Lentinula edodes]
MAARPPPVVLEPTEELPPLPQFESEDIRRQVFTHRSFHGRPNHIFEDHPDDPAPDNEKLEHVGDTVLSLVVTTLMNEMYPTLRVGPSTVIIFSSFSTQGLISFQKMRALIVNNATLANIAVRYNLPNDLRLHPAQAVALKASANVQADLFESYIGGLHQDRGFEVVQRWLRDLFRPYAVSAYRIVRTQHGLLADSQPPRSHKSSDDQNVPSRSPFGDVNRDMTMTTVGHLALFNQHIQRSNQPVEWIYDSTNPEVDPSAQGDIQLLKPEMMKGMKATTIWSVRVIVNGKCLGKGRGGTKKLARNEAAKLGLKSLGIHV